MKQDISIEELKNEGIDIFPFAAYYNILEEDKLNSSTPIVTTGEDIRLLIGEKNLLNKTLNTEGEIIVVNVITKKEEIFKIKKNEVEYKGEKSPKTYNIPFTFVEEITIDEKTKEKEKTSISDLD